MATETTNIEISDTLHVVAVADVDVGTDAASSLKKIKVNIDIPSQSGGDGDNSNNNVHHEHSPSEHKREHEHEHDDEQQEQFVNMPITGDVDLSRTSCDLPQIFSDYYFHTGPLRADPPPVREWPQRIPDNLACIKNGQKYAEKLQDYQILAESCRRASHFKQYADCYFCMGILYDNSKDYRSAIKCYKQFIDIIARNVIVPQQRQQQQQQQQQRSTMPMSSSSVSNTMNITQSLEFDLGLYAAYNALGVDYQLLADMAAAKKNNKYIEYFEESLEYHLKYRDCIMETESNIMNDTNCNSALFIGYTNLGLLLLRCGRSGLAINQFQHALRYSIHISSNIAQAIAICNISLANVQHGNFVVGRACQERYLQLVTALKDVQSQCYAFYNLGTMTTENIEFMQGQGQGQAQNEEKGKMSADAKFFFEEAINVCRYIGDKQLENQLKMKLAVIVVANN